MKEKLAASLLLFTATLLFAFDPLSVGVDDSPANDDESLAYFLIYCEGGPWEGPLNSFVKKHGSEKVGKRIVEFMEPVFDKACVSTYADREYQLCRRGLMALGTLMATNSLPFLERTVLHGREDLRDIALSSYEEITGYGDAYLGLLDRALEEGVIARERYATELTGFCYGVNDGSIQPTPENKLNVAIRLVGNPFGYYLGGSENDRFLLANFPSYTNSAERLAALTAILENQLTPSEGHAKYGPERDRLRALPPEKLVRVTDELEAQLDALLKAAERKEKRARILKIAAGAAVLVAVIACAVAWRRRK